jgi:penicillin amidase
LRGALTEALATLTDRLGSGTAGWSWGALHAADFRHPLGSIRALRRVFNRGPFPLGGDGNTVRHAGFRHRRSPEKGGHPLFGPVVTAPGYRFVVDTGDWDNAYSVLVPGQSGHPTSPNYDDQIGLWLDVRYCPMVYGRKTAKLAARHNLTLRPRS